VKLKSLLEEAIEAWQDARDGVIAEVDNFPANQFGFRPVPDARSVEEMAMHIMEVSLMMAGVLTDEHGSFGGQPFPKLLARYRGPIDGIRGKRAIMTALRRTFRDGAKAFRDVGELHMLQTIVRFDGERGTRLGWMHHGIDQEMYHRGQLATYARLLGLTPALTRLIRGGS